MSMNATDAAHYLGDTYHFAHNMPESHPSPELRAHFRIPMVGAKNVESVKAHVAGGSAAVLMQQV